MNYGNPAGASRSSAARGATAPKRDERALYEQVAEAMRARILSHRLAPGSWIDETSLAAELGISRTPMREALKVLAAEGLVTMKLRRGAYVTEVSARDLAEVFHLLALLESDAAEQAATVATDAQIEELEALHQSLEAALDDRDRFFAINERFHMRLLEIAGSRWRLQVVADLRKVMKLDRHRSLSREGRLESSLAEHRGIMDALRARQPARARQRMRTHIARGAQAAAPS